MAVKKSSDKEKDHGERKDAFGGRHGAGLSRHLPISHVKEGPYVQKRSSGRKSLHVQGKKGGEHVDGKQKTGIGGQKARIKSGPWRRAGEHAQLNGVKGRHKGTRSVADTETIVS